jgi:preprotein translocase subunit SecY
MFRAIFNTLGNCLKIPELKSRIIFTLIVLGICRMTSLIPTPGLNGAALADFIQKQAQSGGGNGLLGMYSLFTGGGFERCAIGSLGIMPYISATIIIQLLTAVVPFLSKLSREEGGRSKIVQYGRVLTLILCVGQGAVMAAGWEHPTSIPGFSSFPGQLVYHAGWLYLFETTIILSTGTMLLMWLGEQITERGIGNGISLVITIGILARLPAAGQGVWDMFAHHNTHGGETGFMFFHGAFLIGLLAVVIAGVIAVTQAQRKIPVQYAQRAVGRKVFSGSSSFMPLRVNYAGVMPVIFAQAILMFPAMIFQWLGGRFDQKFFVEIGAALQERSSVVYLTLYGLMILFFSYFWVATQFNELQIADDMKKSGGYIPGVRPGNATSDFLHRSMTRITLAGAIFLTIIAVIPILLSDAMKIPYNVASFFGGTSLLIIVGVMLDTMRQMESHLLMRHYDGFLKKGRIKGRF